MASPVRKKPLPVRLPSSPVKDVDYKGKGKGKEKERRSAFEILPREIIQQFVGPCLFYRGVFFCEDHVDFV
jgi:hypothetical protein